MADCGIKKLWRAWDLVILTGLIKNNSNIDGGMEKNLLKITDYGHFADNCESDQAGSG